MSIEVTREAVEWMASALSGRATSEDVAARFSPRLAVPGGMHAFFAGSKRFEAFRVHGATVERIDAQGPWSARATIRTGPDVWELDVAVEPDPPHLIRSFQPRKAAPDAVAWTAIAAGLRTQDRTESELPAAIAERVHTRLVRAVDAGCLGGVVAGLAVDGRVVHQETLGVADLDSAAELSLRSVFGVGSVAKAVTALAVLRLAEQGSVDLNSPVRTYLSAPKLVPAAPGDPEPTVAQLLLHRAGLTKSVGRRPAPGKSSLGDAAPQIDLAWAPGVRAEYSNAGYLLLGELVQTFAAEPFAQFCSREILTRFGLQDAGWGTCADTSAAVTGHRVVAGRVEGVPFGPADYPGAGGLAASASDLLTLAGHYTAATDPLIRTALSLTTQAGPGTRFGAGIALLDRPEGTMLWRGGATDGYSAEVLAALDGSATVVLLASKSPPEGLKELASALAAELRGIAEPSA